MIFRKYFVLNFVCFIELNITDGEIIHRVQLYSVEQNAVNPD